MSAGPITERIEAIDVVRGIALFGVLTVNLITGFRVSIFEQFLPATSVSVTEQWVHVLLESKAFALFSLLFGIGLAIQFERLEKTGRPYYFLSRRLAALLIFGVLHLLLVWNGDILTEYAIAGFVVLPFLRLPAESLVKAAGLLLAVFVGLAFFPQPVRLPDTAALQHHVEAATNLYSNGSYREILAFSAKELPLILPLHLNVFPRTVALMLLGAALWKGGVLTRPVEFSRTLGIFAVLAALGGIALSALDTGRVVSGMVAPVALALGYGALVFSIASLPTARAVLRPLAALGRMAFTNYILQSLVFAFVFFGWGMGLFGKMVASQALLLGCAVYAVQMILSVAWLRFFRFGPLEGLWRRMMYGREP